MAKPMYSFGLEGMCPCCGKQLDKVGSVVVKTGRETHQAMVDNHGLLSEDEGTNLILTDPEPDVTCRYCKERLQFEPQEEG